MASEKPEKEKKKDKKDKKEKKEKKEKRSDEDGVKKVKSDKDKKEKKKKHKETEAALEHATQDAASLPIRSANESDDEDAMEVDVAERVVPTSALVPFANPLADEKQHKKLLKAVKKAADNKALKRGVKEVVKALRRSPTTGPPSGSTADAIGVVIIAADISPMDVISHIPVLCEDHNIPYIYVTSRAELGLASKSKRATSVIMLTKAGRAAADDKGAEGYEEAYADLLKLVQKASVGVVR